MTPHVDTRITYRLPHLSNSVTPVMENVRHCHGISRAALDDRDIHAPWEAPPMALLQAGLTLGQHYPRPIVDHALAREETLARFGILKAQD